MEFKGDTIIQSITVGLDSSEWTSFLREHLTYTKKQWWYHAISVLQPVKKYRCVLYAAKFVLHVGI